MIPQNEMETIIVFAQKVIESDWEIINIRPSFPDAVIRNINTGTEYRAEFEFAASNFKAHEHSLLECDVIICWEDDWPTCPIAVWEVKSWSGEEIIPHVVQHVVEIAQLRIENRRLQKQLAIALSDNDLSRISNNYQRENTKILALAILTEYPEITGSELGRRVGRSTRLGRKLKAELLPLVVDDNGSG